MLEVRTSAETAALALEGTLAVGRLVVPAVSMEAAARGVILIIVICSSWIIMPAAPFVCGIGWLRGRTVMIRSREGGERRSRRG